MLDHVSLEIYTDVKVLYVPFVALNIYTYPRLHIVVQSNRLICSDSTRYCTTLRVLPDAYQHAPGIGTSAFVAQPPLRRREGRESNVAYACTHA